MTPADLDYAPAPLKATAAEVARRMMAAVGCSDRLLTDVIATSVLRDLVDRRAARHHRGQARTDGRTAREYRAHKRHLNRADRQHRKATR